jgi:signal recognition particle subunit SRP54
MFENLSEKLSNSFSGVRRKGRLSKEDIQNTTNEIKKTLLDSDVNYQVVQKFIDTIIEQAESDKVKKSLNPAAALINIVEEQLINILGTSTKTINYAPKGQTTIIMLIGLQGSGKTTFAGKIAKYFKSQGRTVGLVANDLQRPGAVEQLQTVGEKAGVEVYAPFAGSGKGNPIKAAKLSLKWAKDNSKSVLIVDTAGRLEIDKNMLKEAKKIKDVLQPNETFFVIDSMIGQNAVITAKSFLDSVDYSAVVLSKLDGDSKGGAALSVAGVTAKPIMFASVGEGIDDLEVFHPDRMASRILDKGDLETLAEKAEKVFDDDSVANLEQKLKTGKGFNLDDFLVQMQQLKKMGSMKKIISMMPGAGQYKQQLENFDEREIVRMEALVQSMTPEEKLNPDIMTAKRKEKIASGAGSTVNKLNDFLKRFKETQKMMASGNIPGVGQMPGVGSAKRAGGARSKNKKKKKGKSGNPAKRALQEKGLL